MNTVISLQYYEDNTVIDTDFDNSKAQNHLQDAHEINLRELLGDELYDRVLLILANPTPTPIEIELVDCLKMFVVKATDGRLIPFLNTPVSAKGTQERSGDYSSSAGQPDKAMRLDVIRASEEYYADICRRFLAKNLKDFPEYKCASGSNDFYSPIHLF